jgi:hypothetical protein
VRLAVLLAALLASLAWAAPAIAQAPRSGGHPGVAQAERNSVELKHGMTLEEVQKLLGRPSRTALKGASGAAADPSQGTLQWTYAWGRERILNVAFAAKNPNEWYVNSWDWSTY